MLEVRVVDMSIYTEESFENDSDYRSKVLWEWNTQRTREDFLIVQLILYPCHQEIDVLTSTNFQGSFNVVTICPKVLILWTG